MMLSMVYNHICRVILSCMVILPLLACSNDSAVPPKESGETLAHHWQRTVVGPEHASNADEQGYTIAESGLTIPHVVARPAPDGQVHIAHYSAVQAADNTFYQQLNYLVCNPYSGQTTIQVVENRPAHTGVDGFDRCNQFDMALDGSTPILIYPTYENDTVLQYIEADIMVNLYESGTWNESTGVVGFVARNPVYQDGHVKDNMSVAVDSQGDIHMAYQFYTEGMDSANYRYPDLFYACRDRATLNVPITDVTAYANIEEQVDGNTFSTYGVHNSIGYHCKLVLDPDESPVIVYAEHDENFNGTFALRVAYRNESGQWQRETVEILRDGFTVGSISAAFYPPPLPDPDAPPPEPDDPEPERPLAIAYALRVPSTVSRVEDLNHHLKFAVKRDGQWSTEIVDETTLCGTHCSLAFTADGLPAIAYFDEESHSGRIHKYLKYAEFNGIMWERESAEEQGAVGRFNTLWFDSSGRPTICTYSEEDQNIVLIRQIH